VQVGEGVRLGDRYVLGPILGAGGVAHVYRAHDERLDAPVAVKVLSIASASAKERLKQEATLQAGLRHPHIVAVTDVVDVEGWPAVVMELVDGPSLEALLDEGPLERAVALDVFRGILEGVAAAHAAGMVHRDLKPGNVLIARVGQRLFPKVADFGLAKVLAGPGGGTRTGAIMGTPRYMSPEQVTDSKQVDHRSDVFALGAILFEMVSGRPAFDGRDTLSLFNRIVMGQHAPLPADLEPELAGLIREALTADLDQRLPSVEAFLARMAPPHSGSFPPELLDRVRPRAVATSVEGNDTWTASVAPPAAAMTAVPDEVEWPHGVSPTSPTMAPGTEPTPSRTWPRWVGAAVLGAALVLGAGAALQWQLDQPPSDAHFAVDDPPTTGHSPEVDRLLGLAWHSVERTAGDADGLLDDAAALAPDEPAVALLRAFSAYPVDADGVRSALAVAVEPSRGAKGPLPELLVAAHDAERAAESPGWMGPVLDAHLKRWPHDRLARLWRLKAMAAAPDVMPFDEPFVTSVLDEAPDHELAQALAVQSYRAHGRFDEADVVGRAALAAGNRTAWMRSELAVNAQQRGRFQEAIDYGVDALRLDPGAWAPRLHAAMGAAHLGDMETFERLVAPMRGDESPVAERRRFSFFVGRGLATLGQLERSSEWAAVAREAAVGSDAQQTLVRIAAMEVEMRLHPWVGGDDDLAARLSVLDRAVADPTLPAAARHEPGLLSVLAHGLLAARSGATGEARRALGRLEGDHADRLTVALAQAADAPAPDVEGCHGLVDGALWSWDRGDVERAVDLATRADGACPHTDSQPFALGWAVRALAEEPGALDAFERTWPRPDAELGVMARFGDAGVPR